jgi:hypothetical protein
MKKFARAFSGSRPRTFWNPFWACRNGVPGTPYLFRRDAPPANTPCHWGTPALLSRSSLGQQASAGIPRAVAGFTLLLSAQPLPSFQLDCLCSGKRVGEYVRAQPKGRERMHPNPRPDVVSSIALLSGHLMSALLPSGCREYPGRAGRGRAAMCGPLGPPPAIRTFGVLPQAPEPPDACPAPRPGRGD